MLIKRHDKSYIEPAKLARGTSTLVIGIDHFGKDPATGTRGSSAKEGDADAVLALLGDRTVNGAVTNARLALRKLRGGQSGLEIPFARRIVDMGPSENGNKPITSCVIDWAPAEAPAAAKDAEKEEKWAKSLRLLRRALMTTLATDQATDGPAGVRAIDLEIVRKEFYSTYPAEGEAEAKQSARRKAFARAVKEAQAKEVVAMREVADVMLIWLATPTTDEIIQSGEGRPAKGGPSALVLPPGAELVGRAPPGERCFACGKGRDVYLIRRRPGEPAEQFHVSPGRRRAIRGPPMIQGAPMIGDRPRDKLGTRTRVAAAEQRDKRHLTMSFVPYVPLSSDHRELRPPRHNRTNGTNVPHVPHVPLQSPRAPAMRITTSSEGRVTTWARRLNGPTRLGIR